jgi:parallel beta-helix repeat protein
MMNFSYHRKRLCTLLSLMLLAAVPAFGQVPQDVTYTGRLVNGSGGPHAGPVDLELRVFDADTAGSQLYSEQHLQVALDATGGFSVQLGLGTSPVGTFDAALFADVNRWLEAVVESEVLTPRPIIASVPWTLVAQQANGIVPAPKTIVVDCDGGDVLQDAIDAAGPKATIQVAGTCTENINIHSWQTRLTIDGKSVGSIAPAGGGPAVTISGREISINNFASISGGGRGIVVSNTASAKINNNVIDGAGVATVGISVEGNSFADIFGNTVQNHTNNGIVVTDGSAAEIGFCGEGQPNTISDNDNSGIVVDATSQAFIRGNQILNNGDIGIAVANSSMADTGSNNISGNGDGVEVRRGSTLRMGRPGAASGCIEDPNSTDGNNNTLFGIECGSLSTVDGKQGTLDGVQGAASLKDTNADCPDCCFTNLAP